MYQVSAVRNILTWSMIVALVILPLSRNCERYKLLLFLKANKLACTVSTIFSDRRHETS